MPLLYYWRGENYRADLDAGAGFHLNQSNPLLHRIDLGDSLWAFTRRLTDGAYVMAAELVIRGRTRNPRGFPYGPYRVWGDLRQSRYFLVPGQAAMEPVLRALSPKMGAARLGQAFQGKAAVRHLNAEDHAILRVACRGLLPEPRARLLPEDRLEYSLLTGEAVQTAWLLAEETGGVSPARRQALAAAPSRSRVHVQHLRELYRDHCQLCGQAVGARYGVAVVDAHHLQWLSRGGADQLDNMVLLCPDHHRIVHARDAHLDFADLHMDFGEGLREPLRLTDHLLPLVA